MKITRIYKNFGNYKNSQKYEFSQIFGSDHVLEPCMELVFQRFLEKSLERIFLLAKNTALAKIYQNYKNSCNFSAGRLTRDNPTPKISCEIQSRHPIQGSCAIWSWSDTASWRTSSIRGSRWFGWSEAPARVVSDLMYFFRDRVWALRASNLHEITSDFFRTLRIVHLPVPVKFEGIWWRLSSSLKKNVTRGGGKIVSPPRFCMTLP